jgi:hypothetical protein
MPRIVLATCAGVIAGLQLIHAQAVPPPARRLVAAQTVSPARLPVRRVVLYKNGVGYFERVGKVRGTEAISIDFSSAQLDDVLNSLTALDLGNGRISGISYNSAAPIGQRLGALQLPVGDRATLSELLAALRGAHLDVRVGDRIIAGRLLGVERRPGGSAPGSASRDWLTLVGDRGDIRTVELTPAVNIKLAERDSADQVGAYLGLLASTRAPDRRRMTISTAGTGERDLLVGYVSEMPIWKTTYRVVLSPDGEPPLLQGWAIVDNTTGEDWAEVELSLVAGAPQSFIQQISQPRYGRRPVVQPSQAVLLSPQTHDPTLTVGSGRIRGAVREPAGALPGVAVRVLDPQRRTVAQAVTDASGAYAISGLPPGLYRLEFAVAGFQTLTMEANVSADSESIQNAAMRVGAVSEAITVSGETPIPTTTQDRTVRRSGSGSGGGFGPGAGGGVGPGVASGVAGGIVGNLAQASPASLDRATVDGRLQDVAPAAAPRELTDLFEYRLNAPISILRGQSALVPILNAPAAVERVSVWNGRAGSRPLRALWLTNSTGLTLDGGSFTVIDEGAFSGEGLLEPLKPQEQRLLSYAVDLGVQIESQQGDERRVLSRVIVQRGVVVEHREQRMRRVYTIRNNDTTDRTVVIEHPTRPGWTLVDGLQPAETSATAYRFKLAAPASHTTTLTVEEKQPLQDRYEVAALTDDQVNLLVRDTGDGQAMKQALEPILTKKASVAALKAELQRQETEIQQISADEQRSRENLAALTDKADERKLVKRYALQLTASEDRIDALRRESAGIARALQAAQMELTELIERLAVDLTVGN